MTTPTPAQADEKALAGVQISGRTIYKLDERGMNIWSANFQPNSGYSELIADEAAQAVFAALRPEGEAVAPVYRITKRGSYVTPEPLLAAFDMADGEHDLFVSPPAPAGVKVKALDWSQRRATADDDDGGHFGCWPGGWYQISRQGRGKWTAGTHETWAPGKKSSGQWRNLGLFSSKTEAKAAAQADYEARIRATLAPSPRAGAVLIDQHLSADFVDDGNCCAGKLATPPATPVQPTASVEAGGTVDEKLVEAVARAICSSLGGDPDETGEVLPFSHFYLDHARAVIAAYRAALVSLTAPTQGDGAQQLLDKALNVLGRCHTVLFNMAKENEGAIFNRWPIHHEPLRSDARNLLPLIDEVLGHD